MNYCCCSTDAELHHTRVALDMVKGKLQTLKTEQLMNRLDIPCIDSYKEQAKPFYEKAKSFIVNKPAALDLLKDLYAYWLTTIGDLYIYDYSRAGTIASQYDKEKSHHYLNILDQKKNRLLVEL